LSTFTATDFFSTGPAVGFVAAGLVAVGLVVAAVFRAAGFAAGFVVVDAAGFTAGVPAGLAVADDAGFCKAFACANEPLARHRAKAGTLKTIAIDFASLIIPTA
jgi:hypothetical protein